ncbi:MAG: ABC transporter substrate-binding protein [Desulfatibacillaceae bacterium]
MIRTTTILAAILVAAVLAPIAAAADIALLPDNAVRDSAGRIIKVEKPFSRIISLYGAHTENLFSLGLDEEVIGVARGDDHPAEAAEKPRFSAHDGPERFLAVQPDLVLVRPMLDRGYAPLMERLASFGVQIASFQPGSVEEMREYWKALGRLTGTEAQALGMVERFARGVGAARELAAAVDTKKAVYFEAIHNKFKTFSPGAMPLFALETAGGVNAAADAASVRGTNIAYYGKERILSRADEIDVYMAQRGTMNQPTVEEIMDEPGYSVIKAIRQNRVVLVDEEIVSRPTLRLLEGIWTMGNALYPDVFDASARQRITRCAESDDSGHDVGRP